MPSRKKNIANHTRTNKNKYSHAHSNTHSNTHNRTKKYRNIQTGGQERGFVDVLGKGVANGFYSGVAVALDSAMALVGYVPNFKRDPKVAASIQKARPTETLTAASVRIKVQEFWGFVEAQLEKAIEAGGPSAEIALAGAGEYAKGQLDLVNAMILRFAPRLADSVKLTIDTLTVNLNQVKKYIYDPQFIKALDDAVRELTKYGDKIAQASDQVSEEVLLKLSPVIQKVLDKIFNILISSSQNAVTSIPGVGTAVGAVLSADAAMRAVQAAIRAGGLTSEIIYDAFGDVIENLKGDITTAGIAMKEKARAKKKEFENSPHGKQLAENMKQAKKNVGEAAKRASDKATKAAVDASDKLKKATQDAANKMKTGGTRGTRGARGARGDRGGNRKYPKHKHNRKTKKVRLQLPPYHPTDLKHVYHTNNINDNNISQRHAGSVSIQDMQTHIRSVNKYTGDIYPVSI